MKFFNQLLIFIFCSAFALSATAQKVSSDRNLNINMDNYDTFAWSTHAANAQETYFLSDAILKSKLRQAIKYELEGHGYVYSDDNADLVVNFRVFEAPLTIVAFEKTYTDENYWSPNEIRMKAIGIIPEAERRELADKKDYFMNAGSLIVQLVERETGRIVWQGYAREMLKKYDENNVKQTVHTLFSEEFNFNS